MSKKVKVTNNVSSPDITERKRMEETLRQSEENLRAYLESAPDGVYLNDLKGKFLYGNKKAEELTGYEREELIGSSFLKLNLLPAKHLAKAGKLLALNAIGRPTGPDEFELIRKDGRRIWVEINTTPIKQGGETEVIGFVRDITERKRAREALKESEEKFRAFMETATDLMHIADKDGNFTYVNESTARTLGYSKEEMVGKHVTQFLSKEVLEKDFKPKWEELITKGAIDVEATWVARDGKEIYGEQKVVAIYDSDGKYAGSQAVFRDLTERKRAEEALQESEERYRALVNLGGSVGEAIVMVQDNKQGKAIHTFVSNEWLSITGYSRKELLGMSFSDLLHPRDREASLARHKKRMSGEIIPGLFEMSIIRKDGTEVPVELTSAYTTYRGERANVAFIRDITERKQAEEALRESRKRYLDLVNLLPQTIFEMDERGNLIFANRQGTLAFGYTLEDVQKGLNALEFFIPEDRDRVRKNVYRILSGEQESGANEYTALRKDGSTFPVISYSSAIIRENKPAGLIGVLMDITERKRMERELQERNERLDAQNEELQSQAEELMTQQQELMEKTREVEKATQLKSEFLANMSHELRTPLNVIIGFSQLMVDEVTGEINEEQRQSLSDILDGSQRLLNLINEVLDLSKIESGKMELKPKDIALTEVIKSLTRTMMPILAPRKQSLDIEIEEGLPPVHADKAKLGQVLLNLVDNSSKFTPDGGKLKIEAVKEGDWCRVSVIDNGVGIKQEDQERIFEPFCRLDNPLTKGRSGTGLGLVLVKQIVERYGGRIWVESEHGKGSRFTITVSLAASGQPNPEERDRR